MINLQEREEYKMSEVIKMPKLGLSMQKGTVEQGLQNF